ncbi:SDR family NAD(P)-dependent oxidoreductase [Aromatoleum sp.]|uniref:SDR family NAD(P)-dependent oxidoreductase n=1 Tax=Aromatoleum sp. TaxID=2307007 RepID=UPI002FC59B5B
MPNSSPFASRSISVSFVSSQSGHSSKHRSAVSRERRLRTRRSSTTREAAMNDRLKDRIAIVTGSDSGIGQAIAEAFAAEGADVVVTYLDDRQGADETRGRIETAGRRAEVIRVDQREPLEVDRLFRETRNTLGIPYILVNNAAVGGVGGQWSTRRRKTGTGF